MVGKLSRFKIIRTTYSSQTLRQQFGQLASVKEDALYEYDDLDKSNVLSAHAKFMSGTGDVKYLV